MRRAVYLVLPLAVATAPASAQNNASPVLARQAGFKQMGRSFKTTNDLIRKGAPKQQILAALADLKRASTGMPRWFPRGSGPESGVKTAAKPGIWTDAAGFGGAVTHFSKELRSLEAVVRTGSVEDWQDKARALGATCASCHSRYRAKS